MKWIIVIIATINGHEIPTANISGFRFPTHAACMADADIRAGALASVGAHGKYLCMYHNEPDRDLRRTAMGVF